MPAASRFAVWGELTFVVASIGHFVVGALAGRLFVEAGSPPKRTAGAVATFALLAFVPDLDVAWVAMGVADHGAGGHRGFTHTFAFAVLLGMVGALACRRSAHRPMRAFLFVAATVASHGILDALTFDSRGVMLFWPFADVTIAFGWRPIPSAPTGLAFVGLRGMEVAVIELIFFSPVLFCVVFPPRSFTLKRPAAVTIAALASVVVCSLFFAELVWRNVSLVSRLEAPSEREVALRDRHRLRMR